MMKQEVDENHSAEITTTVGDLICAIKEAAEEAQVEGEILDELTHLILMDLLRRAKKNL